MKENLAVTDYSSPTHSDTSSENESTLLIDPLRVDGVTEHSAWLSTVTTTNGNVTCKLDTGAEASILPISAYNKLLIKPSLKPTNMKLSAYGGSSINRVGTCILQCSGKDKPHNVKFYVGTVPILGLGDCERLGLVKRVDVIEAGQLTKSALKEQYKNVFTVLGSIRKYRKIVQDTISHYKKTTHQ